jgi:stringent starvation protein B
MNKLDVFKHILFDSSVLVNFDGRRKGVRVPPVLKGEPNAVLAFDFGGEDDLEFDVLGISATLRFNGEDFWCLVPWSAVFAVRREGDGLGKMWSESVPREVWEPKPERRLRLVHSV